MKKKMLWIWVFQLVPIKWFFLFTKIIETNENKENIKIEKIKIHKKKSEIWNVWYCHLVRLLYCVRFFFCSFLFFFVSCLLVQFLCGDVWSFLFWPSKTWMSFSILLFLFAIWFWLLLSFLMRLQCALFRFSIQSMVKWKETQLKTVYSFIANTKMSVTVVFVSLYSLVHGYLQLTPLFFRS